jgi:hypothetical protein
MKSGFIFETCYQVVLPNIVYMTYESDTRDSVKIK